MVKINNSDIPILTDNYVELMEEYKKALSDSVTKPEHLVNLAKLESFVIAELEKLMVKIDELYVKKENTNTEGENMGTGENGNGTNTENTNTTLNTEAVRAIVDESIKKVQTDLDEVKKLVNEKFGDLNTLTTTDKSNVVVAINEVAKTVNDKANNSVIGDLNTLTTTKKGNVVEVVNELVERLKKLEEGNTQQKQGA